MRRETALLVIAIGPRAGSVVGQSPPTHTGWHTNLISTTLHISFAAYQVTGQHKEGAPRGCFSFEKTLQDAPGRAAGEWAGSAGFWWAQRME